jgi:hypothetical protein
MGLDNLRNIINANMGVKDAFGLYNYNGALLTETMAASKIYLHPFQTQLYHCFLQRFPDFKCLT